MHYELSVLSAEEYQQIVYDWNDTDKDYPRDKTIHALFSEQAARTPNRLAMLYEGQSVTYRELNERSNQLAHYLRRQYEERGLQLTPDTMIALCLERSFEMVIGILGILKAGAAYVPIDPKYPDARVSHMLHDIGCEYIITESGFVEYLSRSAGTLAIHCVCLDTGVYTKEESRDITSTSQAGDLAYLLYTSGSTGDPKGVMVTHTSVVNYVTWMTHHAAYCMADVVDCSSSIAFGATVNVLLVPLLYGQCVSLCKEEVKRDAHLFIDYLALNRVNLVKMTPSYLNGLLNATENEALIDKLSHLRCLILGGERANANDVKRWNTQLPDCVVIHHYGSTEMTVGCTSYPLLTAAMVDACVDGIPLGRIAYNSKAYVLDARCHLLPIGAVGELHVGGACLARGYLNQAELTETRFIANPFATERDKALGYTRLYKTGDLVRWREDGHLEYVGRNDFQVKIRGFRIELGEIEHTLCRYPGIEHALVIHQDGALFAYYISRDGTDEDALRTHMASLLPEYMLPNAYMALEAFPLTINGKLDRKALPAAVFVPLIEGYQKARNELEDALCALWANTLGVSHLGIDDDFFRLGGHSILAMQVAYRMSQLLRKEVLVADIFKHRTIARLMDALHEGAGLFEIERHAGDSAPLSYAQERLWFIEQYEGGTHAYHIPLLLQLDATADAEALMEALRAVVRRHAVLRTYFVQDEMGQWLQQVQEAPLAISRVEGLARELVLGVQTLAATPFDLTTSYPIRARFCEALDSHTRFIAIIIHHVAFDGWSRALFMREFHHYYQRALGLADASLKALPLQYKDYAIWQRSQLSAARQGVLLSYWEQALAGHEPLAFPTDYPRPAVFDYRGASHYFELPKALSMDVMRLAKQQGVTLYTVLLSGLALVLSRYSGQEDVLIGALYFKS